MGSSNWDNEGPVQKAPRRGSWTKWLVIGALVFLGLPAAISGVFGGMALSHRTQIWRAIRVVHARIQTDEGARDLYLKNPALAGAYARPEEFLETVRGWRGKVGGLPAQEPPEGKDYVLELDPEGASVRMKGLGGAWMKVEIHGGALSGPEDGEGLVRLFFGEDAKGVDAAEKEAYERKDEHERAEFRQLFQQCSENASAAALYRKEPGLQASYPTEAAFLDHLRPLRPAIADLMARQATKEERFHRQRRESPLGRTVAFTLDLDNGQRLTAVWRNGKLSNVDGAPPADLR